MAELCLKVVTSEGMTIYSDKGENEAALVLRGEYAPGDHIVITSSEYPIYLAVQVDECLGEALVYLKQHETAYHIPSGEKRKSYSPKAFAGDIHLITVRRALPEEVCSYRNLAKNVMDSNENEGLFPHVSANFETRGEAVFAARNVIDGVRVNLSHGEWPYQSWGINMRNDAELKLDFGRTVVTDRIVLVTRADFPHDNWWTRVTLVFSDGSSIVWKLEKSTLPHILQMEKKQISWLRLCELVKSDDPSPFPALTEIEVYGTEI